MVLAVSEHLPDVQRGQPVKRPSRATITLTRPQAMQLYLSAAEGEVRYEHMDGGANPNTGREYLSYKRAMHAVAIAFGFLDHFPEVK